MRAFDFSSEHIALVFGKAAYEKNQKMRKEAAEEERKKEIKEIKARIKKFKDMVSLCHSLMTSTLVNAIEKMSV